MMEVLQMIALTMFSILAFTITVVLWADLLTEDEEDIL
jgi:hypothetical protein